MFDPYKESQKVDVIVNSLLANNEINNAEIARTWMTFNRTVQSTIDIVDKTAHNFLKLRNSKKFMTVKDKKISFVKDYLYKLSHSELQVVVEIIDKKLQRNANLTNIHAKRIPQWDD